MQKHAVWKIFTFYTEEFNKVNITCVILKTFLNYAVVSTFMHHMLRLGQVLNS